MEAFLTPLKDAMHGISEGLLIPTIIILLFLLALSVVELGGFFVEILTERRRKRVKAAELIEAFQGKTGAEQISEEIKRYPIFGRQKAALNELIRHSQLPDISLQSLARSLIAAEERHYFRITDRTDLVTRLAPMFGLMGTLIPLGPGIIALSQGNTKALGESLLIAFDTTVVGLTAAGIAFVISRLRKRWYEEYLNTLEVLMESLLEVFACEEGAEKREAQEH